MLIKITRLTFLFTVFSVLLIAQNRQAILEPAKVITKGTNHSNEVIFRMDMDTLRPPTAADPCSDSLFIFGVSDTWGAVAGMNGLNDQEKGMFFESDKIVALNVTEVWANLGAIVVNDGNLRARIYALNPNGEPGALLGTSVDLKVSEINTNDEITVPTLFTFEEPVMVNDNKFIATIDFSSLYASQDTVFIFQTDDGCGDGALTWELWEDNSWNQVINTWGLDFELAMQVVVEEGEPLVIPARDTLFAGSFQSECDSLPTIFGISDQWGFISGTNGFGDLEKAQRFDYNGPGQITLTDISVFFTGIAVNNDGGVLMKIYDVAADGSPGDILYTSAPVKISSLAEFPMASNFNFTEPVLIPEGSFYAGIDISDLYNTRDTLGIVHTNEGCGDGSLTWDRFSDGGWVAWNDQGSWQLNSNLYMAAFVDIDVATSVNDLPKVVGGITLHPAFPNPAQTYFTLQFDLEETTVLQLEIYHANGQLMKTQDLGRRSSGSYQEEIQIEDLSNGLYYYSLTSDRGSLVQRFILQK